MKNKDYVESRYLVNETMRTIYRTPLFEQMDEKNQGDLARMINDVHGAYLSAFMNQADDKHMSRLLMSCVMDGVNLGRMSAQREREQASLDRNLAQLKAKVEKAKGAKEEPQKADDDLFLKGFQT